MSHTSLHLFKQNFKFSSAHFLIFDKKSAEKLHGHNYQVQIDLKVPESADLSSSGYFVDFTVFKKFVKELVDAWDEHVLLPEQHPDMKFSHVGPSLEVRFRDRFYVFPKNEVVLLPITNTSVEQLARILAEKCATEFSRFGISELSLSVEETQGQSARYHVSKT